MGWVFLGEPGVVTPSQCTGDAPTRRGLPSEGRAWLDGIPGPHKAEAEAEVGMAPKDGDEDSELERYPPVCTVPVVSGRTKRPWQPASELPAPWLVEKLVRATRIWGLMARGSFLPRRWML